MTLDATRSRDGVELHFDDFVYDGDFVYDDRHLRYRVRHHEPSGNWWLDDAPETPEQVRERARVLIEENRA